MRAIIMFVLAVLLMAILGVSGLSRYGYLSRFDKGKYPYGYSHSCDKCLVMALRNYAADHGGRFPTGGNCPEASLSLLYPDYADVEMLRGRTVPGDQVERKLSRGQQLDADTCGWHYVDGLTTDDSPELALFWDKVGLGHNGEKLDEEGHTVFFVNSTSRFIHASEWPAFLENQRRLMEKRKQK